MSPFRVLALLLLGATAWAQVGTPPACPDAVTDHEVFRAANGRVKFHLRYHVGASAVDGHAIIKLGHQAAPDASCTDGALLDVFIDELVKQRNQFLPQP